MKPRSDLEELFFTVFIFVALAVNLIAVVYWQPALDAVMGW